MLKRLGLAGALFAASGALSAITYTVTSTADSGAGTLRQAILDANANPGADTIAFNIVGIGRAHDRPGDAASPDHRSRDDRRLHPAGLLAQHERRWVRGSTRSSMIEIAGHRDDRQRPRRRRRST